MIRCAWAQRRTLRLALATVAAIAVATCGGNPTTPSGSTDAVFTVAPVRIDQIQRITPLGVMSGGFHVLPARHAGMYLVSLTPVQDVLAPAGGTVEFLQRGADDLVRVKVTGDLSYELGHVRVANGIQQGSRITAGQRLGTTSELSGSIDFGVINRQVTRPFVTPSRYDTTGLNADHFLAHYAEPLRSQLAALVPTTGDKMFTDCLDRDGTLEGNWFATGTPSSTDAQHEAYWPGYLAFAYDAHVQTQAIVSYGTALGVTISGGTEGPFGVLDGPAPESVTPASGLVVYHLTFFLSPPGTFGSAGSGTVIVQMLDARHIKVEGFPDLRASPAFDGNAKTYER